MPSDLPDYTKLISVNVAIPEVEVGPVNVGWYKAAPADLPDGTRGPLLTDVKGRLIVVQYEKDRTITDGQIKPRPKGGIVAKGSITSAAAYATVASRTVTNLKQFQLAKVVISAEKAAWFKYRWAGVDISCERLMDDKTIVLEHFPWDYYTMTGDGAKAFEVQAKYYSEAGTVNAEIVGEEV
jgi:hypothetical protein